MKQIGAAIGVNESRVSQLHARAIRRLRDALGDLNPQDALEVRNALVAFAAKKPMAKAAVRSAKKSSPGVVLPYKPATRLMSTVAMKPVRAREIAVAAAR